MPDQTRPVLELRNVSVEIEPSGTRIVEGVDLTAGAGEIVGLVGESGSGKTTLGLLCSAHLRRGARLTEGGVFVDGVDISKLAPRDVARLRGSTVAHVPQSPGTALNPARRLGVQMREAARAAAVADVSARIQEVLDDVRLPGDPDFLRRYPHQISGGQAQRITIATAFLARPKVVILDEPGTGLDVSTQKHVTDTIGRLCQEYEVAALYITHDMATVASIATKLAVMYCGELVEIGACREVVDSPKHPYTRRLIMAVPDVARRTAMVGIAGNAPDPRERPSGCAYAPRCDLAIPVCSETMPTQQSVGDGHLVRCFRAADVGVAQSGSPPLEAHTKRYTGAILEVMAVTARHGATAVLHDVSLGLPRGACVALVGESGSGKTTLARCIVGLHGNYEGQVALDGALLPHKASQRPQEARRRIQYIFQNPYASLNPRRTVRELVLGHARVLLDEVPAPDQLVSDALERVALRKGLANRYPTQLSGGERQRVAIARALVTNPEVLLCDEITSALDVSIQATIVELLRDLQKSQDMTLLFITHNIALARNMADTVLVMQDGAVVERGTADGVFSDPQHNYTQQLLTDTPSVVASTRTRV